MTAAATTTTATAVTSLEPPPFSAWALGLYIRSLTAPQQAEVARELSPWLASLLDHRPRRRAGGPAVEELEEARFREGLRCVHCGHDGLAAWGSYRNRARYRCRACGKTFNTLTGTPFAHAKRSPLWPDFARCHLLGYSVRKTAKVMGVHPATAFRWRHRLMNAIRRLTPEVLAGVVEADETYFRHSRKGQRDLRNPRKRGQPAKKRGLSKGQVAVLTARDREGRTVARVAGRGKPTSAAIADVLTPSVRAGSTLCTDGADGYRRFCAGAGVAHQPVGNVPGTRVVGGVYHIQHINAYHRRLKQWMRRFNGVATKYLDNYLRWHVFVEATKDLARRAARHRLLLDACAA